MSKPERPLSPHLSVYRWELHMLLSILHRGTGVFLGFGAVVLTYWLVSIAMGPAQYDAFQELAGSLFGRLVLMAVSFAAVLHLLNGIRHLFWDLGKGFALDQVKRSGQLVIFLTLILSSAFWYLAGLLPELG